MTGVQTCALPIYLLEPGDTPSTNAQFLLVLTAVIKAVDEYQDLLRLSVASAGNDHRLGANEAPPAIISMFLGEELTDILDAIKAGTLAKDKHKCRMAIGATVLPTLPKDTTDRNRTSPFAFTGNKFEFRMGGSAQSISIANTVLNTIVAETMGQFADLLENSSNFTVDLNCLIKKMLIKHDRIIFNGNNYSAEWVAEADKRGLLNLLTTVDAAPYYMAKKNVDLFTKHNIFTNSEIKSRHEVLLENYCKTLHIEALAIIDIVKKEIIPSTITYEKELAKLALAKKQLGIDISSDVEYKLLDTLSRLASSLFRKLDELETSIIEVKAISNAEEQALYYKEEIFVKMTDLRCTVDELETLVAKKYWSYPTYAEILYSVK